MSVLEIENINVRTSDTFELQDIRFSLKPGELIGVIGPNGAGKSTLARALVGLLDLQGGEITYDGKPTSSFSDQRRAALLGYLPQSANFSWDLSVTEAIKLGRMTKPPGSDNPNFLHEVLLQVGLSHVAHRRVFQLSGGEQMRVHLARLFYGRHKTLIADEPCASLDIEHQHRIMKLLHHAARESGAMVILHDFSLAQLFCDKLLLMNAGRIILQGSPNEVFNSPLTAKIFGMEFRRFNLNTSASEFMIFPSLPANRP